MYLGTSPRVSGVNGTCCVHTASEIDGWQTVSPHLEMSFAEASMPQKILFWADHVVPPGQHGGETPLVDFGAVWDEMQPEVAARFADRGVR